MWKIFLAFVVFAAVGLYILKQSGADVDMGGEKHDVSGGHSETAASAPTGAAAAASAVLAAPEASAASR